MAEHSMDTSTVVGSRHLRNQDAAGYVHAVHPDHGEPVVYVPGERLPTWVVEAIDADRKDGKGRYVAAPDKPATVQKGAVREPRTGTATPSR